MADDNPAIAPNGDGSQVYQAPKVWEIIKGRKDSAGDLIITVFSYSPPEYAIYRTRERLKIQFSDVPEVAAEQRKRVSPLAAIRGQINGLINGWHTAALAGQAAEPDLDGDAPESTSGAGGAFGTWIRDRFPAPRIAAAKRATRYDRRVSDALIILLEDPQALETAQTLLAQVKNDIIAERTSIARFQYVRWAVYLVAAVVLLTSALASNWFHHYHPFQRGVGPAWTAVAGGGFGAFFSLAIGLKSREVSIDLQKLENLVEVLLRMLIGAIAGGIFFALLVTQLVTVKLVDQAALVAGDRHYSDTTVFLVGFVAGFLERLVPNLLNKTNFGTTEPAGQDTPKPAPPPTPVPAPAPDSPPDGDEDPDDASGEAPEETDAGPAEEATAAEPSEEATAAEPSEEEPPAATDGVEAPAPEAPIETPPVPEESAAADATEPAEEETEAAPSSTSNTE